MAIKYLWISILATVAFAVPPFASSAQESNEGKLHSFKIDIMKPSVFLEFVRFEAITPEGSNVITKVSWLKLVNNSRYPIAVNPNFDIRKLRLERLALSDGVSVDTIPDRSVVELCFDVDVIPSTSSLRDKDNVIAGIQSKDHNPASNDKTTCFWRNEWRADQFGNGYRTWIRPQHSVIFSVPSNYLKQNLKVSVLFSYEWEFNGGKLNFEEPKHKVYFYGSDLPN